MATYSPPFFVWTEYFTGIKHSGSDTKGGKRSSIPSKTVALSELHNTSQSLQMNSSKAILLGMKKEHLANHIKRIKKRAVMIAASQLVLN